MRHTAGPDTALAGVLEIFRVMSGSKALLDQDGRLVAHSPEANAAFRAQAVEAPSLGLVRQSLAQDGPLAGYTLVEARPDGIAGCDPTLLHDLRDALHALSLLLETGPAGAMESAMADRIRTLATQVATLVAAPQPPETIDLGEILRDTAAALEPKLAAEGATLTLTLPETPQLMRGSRRTLLRLLQNMLLNAARHAGKGQLSLRLRASEGAAGPTLELEDGGPGLPPALAAWLTAPQGTPTPEELRPEGGHGYGLSIIRDAAHTLGARLELAAGPPQLLRLHLPVVRGGPSDTLAQGRLSQRRLWLAENNATVAGLLERALRAEGAEVLILPTPEAVRAAAAGQIAPPDLMLCDFFLGSSTGAELSRRLQAQGFDAPIVVLTADPSPDTRAQALVAGAAQVWLKPLGGQEMAARIAACLGSPDPGVRVFDTEIAAELLEDAGQATLHRFMSRALQEAQQLHQAIVDPTDGNALDDAALRAALHSAIGACGITGLGLLSQRLSDLHAKVVSGESRSVALAQLLAALQVTEARLAQLDLVAELPLSQQEQFL